MMPALKFKERKLVDSSCPGSGGRATSHQHGALEHCALEPRRQPLLLSKRQRNNHVSAARHAHTLYVVVQLSCGI